jgi:hypothetical protein
MVKRLGSLYKVKPSSGASKQALPDLGFCIWLGFYSHKAHTLRLLTYSGVLRKGYYYSRPKIVAPNFRNKNFHATNEKSNQGVRVPPSLSPRGGTQGYLKIEPSILVSLHRFFFFFFLCDGPIKLAQCPLKK